MERWALVLFFATLASGGVAQVGERPLVFQPEIRLGPDSATNPEMATFWAEAFLRLDPAKQLRVRLVRGGYNWELDMVVEIEARESLLIVTTGLNQSGRRRVIVRADDVIAIEESPRG